MDLELEGGTIFGKNLGSNGKPFVQIENHISSMVNLYKLRITFQAACMKGFGAFRLRLCLEGRMREKTDERQKSFIKPL